MLISGLKGLTGTEIAFSAPASMLKFSNIFLSTRFQNFSFTVNFLAFPHEVACQP